MNFRRLCVIVPFLLATAFVSTVHAGGFRNSSSGNYGESYSEPKKEDSEDQICEQKTQMFKGPWGDSKNALFVLCSDGHMWVIDMNSPNKGWSKVPDVKNPTQESDSGEEEQ